MISLVVATVNRVADLDRLLCSLEHQSYRDFEVIVVDQNPDDRLVPVLSLHSSLGIQHLRSERGISRARNVGLSIAKGDIIAIPDDDCWYPQHLLASVRGWFQSHPRVGLLSTALRTAENQPSVPNLPATPLQCTRSGVWRCAISPALFMRRSVSLAVGGFNEELGVGAASAYQAGEEIDYVLRALDRGFQIWYDPSLTVHHPPFGSIEHLARTTYPYALGTGRVRRIHHFPLHQFSWHLIRTFGGAAVSLCRGDLVRTRVYVLRGAGQLLGYVSRPRNSIAGTGPAGK
jgi:glycosyltransferase involved in cell wall biosynthesis